MRELFQMSAKRLLALAAVTLPLAAPALAADATPEQAQALEQQIRDWVTGLLGPTVKIANRPVVITPEGDHYAVAVPFGDAPDSPQITAAARAADGGRWNIDNIRLPSPSEFRLNLPQPGDKTAATVAPINYKLTIGQQAGQILYDPSFATPSTLTSTLQNLDLVASGDVLQQTSHLDRSSTTSILRPAAAGRVDLLTDSSMEGYRINSKTTDGQDVQVGIGRARLTGQVSGVSSDRAVQILQALIQVGSTMKTGDAGPPKMDDKSLQILLEAVADFASGVSFDESLERLQVTYAGMGGTLNGLRLGFAAKSEAGLMQARMDIGAEGLALPDLPLGDLAQLIPTKVALRPSVSGVATNDLVRLAKASQDNGTPSPADIQALFSHGGITTGLDSFSVDLAGATIAGLGKLVFTSPEAFSGTAQITATNLDLLQQRVAAMPEAAQAIPVFILAKGIGRAVNNQVVWDVSYRDGRVLVNNQDLSAMMGGAPSAPQEPAKPPARPQQQRPQNRTR
jgi:hypothetical protein